MVLPRGAGPRPGRSQARQPGLPKILTWTLPRPSASMGTVAAVLVLVHSPNLGPGSWRPVADELTRAGHQVVVPSLAGFTDGGPPYVPRLVRLAAGQVPASPAGEVILVTHSGAGVFVPHLVRAVATREATA